MSSRFNFEAYGDFDFFHYKYGRGAVIVALEKNNRPGNHISEKYHGHHGPSGSASSPWCSPVLSISENDRFVRVILKIPTFEYYGPPAKLYAEATIERLLPLNHVTFEVVRAKQI